MITYCKRFDRRTDEAICLACEHCQPPAKRVDGKMCEMHVNKDPITAYLNNCRNACYDRQDLCEVANRIELDLEMKDISQGLWDAMADAAFDYLKNLAK